MPWIIETSCNCLFRVRETGSTDLVHVWYGIEVKRIRGAFVDKAKARETMVRKIGARIVSVAR
jgi:hypothetical protein